MKFKTPALELEFREALHPDVREALEELDAWSAEQAIPGVVLTCISRNAESNAKANGKERSWHLVNAAADLRTWHYTPAQRAAVLGWLQSECPREGWELLLHDAGTGSHIHLARKDMQWRLTFGKAAVDA